MARPPSFLWSWLSGQRPVSGSETCAWEEPGMARQALASRGGVGGWLWQHGQWSRRPGQGRYALR